MVFANILYQKNLTAHFLRYKQDVTISLVYSSSVNPLKDNRPTRHKSVGDNGLPQSTDLTQTATQWGLNRRNNVRKYWHGSSPRALWIFFLLTLLRSPVLDLLGGVHVVIVHAIGWAHVVVCCLFNDLSWGKLPVPLGCLWHQITDFWHNFWSGELWISLIWRRMWRH